MPPSSQSPGPSVPAAPRITVDVRFYFASGIGTYLRHVLPALTRKSDLNVAFTVLVRPQDRAAVAADLPDCELIEMNSAPLSIGEQFEFRKIIPRDTALLWIPHINVPLLYRGRFFVTLHDILGRYAPRGFALKSWLLYVYGRIVLRHIDRRAGALLCDSEFTRREWMKFYGRSSGLRVAPLGVPQQWFDLRSGKTKSAQPPYLLYIGNVKPHKNLARLIEAFDLLRDRLPHALRIVGRIAGLRSIDQRIANIENDERVQVMGHVSDAELREHLARADLFVFPSLYEGYGLPPLEAMAAGVPTAVADIPVIREVCGDGPVFFDPRDPGDMARVIYEHLTNAEQRKLQVSRGLEHARALNWDRCIAAPAETIAKLTGPHADAVKISGPALADYAAKMAANPLVQDRRKKETRTKKGPRSAQSPLVSIVTVVRNANTTLPDTMQSVARQTYADIEYIIVDGGSTDGTLGLIEAAARDGLVQAYVSEGDEGISDGFNRGLGLARGEIIGILNADDWYEDDAVELAVRAFAEQPEAAVACAQLQYWRDGRRDAVFPSHPEDLGIDMTVNHPTMFVRRDAYAVAGLFKPEYRYAMDYELALRFRRLGFRFANIDTIIANMRLAGTGDRNWRRGLREMRRAQKELYPGKFFVPYIFRVLRAYVGRFLHAAGLEALNRLYRSRFSKFKRSYAPESTAMEKKEGA